ncbi:hypothetical protein H8356DRAFT_1415709 [Neocallimastix lanati (nom. inval.)]|nr:hypothetical protein H8356DRAFT_1415709 [Neocallimastix sp. JGI-2020a]
MIGLGERLKAFGKHFWNGIDRTSFVAFKLYKQHLSIKTALYDRLLFSNLLNHHRGRNNHINPHTDQEKTPLEDKELLHINSEGSRRVELNY